MKDQVVRTGPLPQDTEIGIGTMIGETELTVMAEGVVVGAAQVRLEDLETVEERGAKECRRMPLPPQVQSLNPFKPLSSFLLSCFLFQSISIESWS